MVTPYPFEDLKQYTKDKARMINAVAQAFPGRGYDVQILEVLQNILSPYVGHKLEISFESFETKSFSQYMAQTPDNFVSFVASLTPPSGKVIIEPDFDFCMTLIDKMLGGSGEARLENHRITSLDKGALQFLFTKVLSQIDHLVDHQKLGIKLEQVESDKKGLQDFEDDSTPMAVLNFRLHFSSHVAGIRVCFPAAFLRDWERNLNSLLAIDKDSFTSEGFNKFLYLKTVLWAGIGHLDLSGQEASQLEPGDILFFDDFYADFDGQKISGPIQLNIGEIEHGSFAASLVEDKDQLKINIEGLS